MPWRKESGLNRTAKKKKARVECRMLKNKNGEKGIPKRENG